MSSKDTYVTAFMANIPSRKEALQRVVDSILPQVDKLNIYLNYPKNEPSPNLKKDPKLTLVHAGENDLPDLGCNGKFYKIEQTENGYIFTIDDDLLYPPDYVQNLCKKIEKYNRQVVVGLHGGILPKRVKNYSKERNLIHCSRPLLKDIPVNILGTGVSAFHKSTIKITLDDFKSKKRGDMWFAIKAQKEKVPLVCVGREFGISKEFVYPGSIWSQRKKLSKQNNKISQKVSWKVYKYNRDLVQVEELKREEITKNVLQYKKYYNSIKSSLSSDYKVDMINYVKNTSSKKIVLVQPKQQPKQQKQQTFLIHVNTKYHFETVASFIYIALAKGLKVHIFMKFPDPNRRKYLNELFQTDQVKFVRKIDYSLYSTILFITYYPNRFPILERVKYVTNSLKKIQEKKIGHQDIKVYLVTHEFFKFKEEQHLKRHQKTYNLCYLSPLGYNLSKKIFDSSYILPVYFLKEFPKPKSLEKFNEKPKVILIQGNISTARRNYQSLIEIAEELKEENFYFKIMGKGDPKEVQKLFKKAPKDKFKFLIKVSDAKYFKECAKSDFIMPLVDQSYEHDYFESKLTSSVSVAYGFNLIPILHLELANIYKLPGKYSYTGIEQSRLEAVRSALSITYEDYLEVKKKMNNKYNKILENNKNLEII